MFWFTHWQNVFLKMVLKAAAFWKFYKGCRNISMSFLLRKLQYVESPYFWTKHSAKYNILGIYKIFNKTNSKYLDCQIWFQ